MSLHFTLHINGKSIDHTVAIVRIKPAKPIPAASTICTYQVDHFGPDDSPRRRTNSVEVRHRYGDGALELARKALNALHEKNA